MADTDILNIKVREPVVDEFDNLLDDDTPHVGIKDLSEESRPREKMMKEGESNLSYAELLAILIGSGTTKKSAVELMDEVLHDCGYKLALLDRMSVEELKTYNGIGEAKAITIKAALELSNRRIRENLTDMTSFRSAEKVYQYMNERFKKIGHEECWALLLNNSAKLLRAVKLSQGGRTGTTVDTRILLKKAILAEATTVVLTHNHPSGSLRPSKEDDNLTRYTSNALAAVDIRLLDHVIIADGGYYSYNEEGRL